MEFMFSIIVLEMEIDVKKKSGRYTFKRKKRKLNTRRETKYLRKSMNDLTWEKY